MRILGLDFGTRRIGVALSDGLLITAQAVEAIERKDLQSDLARISALIKENDVGEVVVGLPLNMNGTHSQKTKEALDFVEILTKAVDVPVRTYDERLSSLQAERFMLEADMSRRKRKAASDKLAAQIILQGYMDFKKKGER